MKGRLYLGRISDLSYFQSLGVECFAITKSDKFHKYMKVFYGLAPSWELLKWHNLHKNRKDFNEGYYDMYFKQVKESKQAQEDIKEIRENLDRGHHIALICFCPTHDRCHRGIIGKWFEKKGYKVEYK